jgi:alpha-tubulin suppressor-like RCC1 family protein
MRTASIGVRQSGWVAVAGTLMLTACGGSSTGPPASEKLGFTVQPTATEGTQHIAPALEVAILDASGGTVTTATDAVTLALGTNPGGGTLSGTTTVNAVAGIATFATLSIDRPGTYTFVATSGTLSGATSTPFAVRLTFSVLSAGPSFTCGVTVAHAAYCWGQNGGQLGDGTTTNRTSPVLVTGGLNFTAVTAGTDGQACGVTTAHDGYCWGYNGDGDLGDGTTINRTSPVLVAGGLRFLTISAGGVHTCGMTTAGAAYCWGSNSSGQLGDGTTTGRTSPVAVTGGHTFLSVSLGSVHSCGVTTTGVAYCWGANPEGALGIGDSTIPSVTSPTLVMGALTFATLGPGGEMTCGVTSAHAGYCWGRNDNGQLGTGSAVGPQDCFGVPCSTVPALVIGGLSLALVGTGGFGGSVGGAHSCGLTTAGNAYCWGGNAQGQLGDGTTMNSSSPVLVVGAPTFATVTTGGRHSCGMTSAGAAYCWGDNTSGQLGNGTTTSSQMPVQVVQ